MRHSLRTAAFLTVAISSFTMVPASSSAQNLTARDLVALAQAGLGDEVLIALIDADTVVFRMGYAEVLDLRKQGLSERVLVRMIRTESEPRIRPVRTPVREQSTSPEPVVIHQTIKQEVIVEAPRVQPQREYVAVPVYVAVPTRPREPEKAPEPVYWGFGGQRRPDSWPDRPATTSKPGGG